MDNLKLEEVLYNGNHQGVSDTDPFGWNFKLPRRIFDSRGHVKVWVESRSQGRFVKDHQSGGL